MLKHKLTDKKDIKQYLVNRLKPELMRLYKLTKTDSDISHLTTALGCGLSQYEDYLVSLDDLDEIIKRGLKVDLNRFLHIFNVSRNDPGNSFFSVIKRYFRPFRTGVFSAPRIHRGSLKFFSTSQNIRLRSHKFQSVNLPSNLNQKAESIAHSVGVTIESIKDNLRTGNFYSMGFNRKDLVLPKYLLHDAKRMAQKLLYLYCINNPCISIPGEVKDKVTEIISKQLRIIELSCLIKHFIYPLRRLSNINKSELYRIANEEVRAPRINFYRLLQWSGSFTNLDNILQEVRLKHGILSNHYFKLTSDPYLKRRLFEAEVLRKSKSMLRYSSNRNTRINRLENRYKKRMKEFKKTNTNPFALFLEDKQRCRSHIDWGEFTEKDQFEPNTNPLANFLHNENINREHIDWEEMDEWYSDLDYYTKEVNSNHPTLMLQLNKELIKRNNPIN